MPSKRYAIEARYEGEDPPWKGWQVIRMYSSAQARNKDLAVLRKNGSQWAYRIYQG